ncbi:MAG TPA: hypothetical protein DIC64_00855 [Alphaproteobacteria bacterium]|nr:hypothetical protein [Alphaproteobacteria bacterium]
MIIIAILIAIAAGYGGIAQLKGSISDIKEGKVFQGIFSAALSCVAILIGGNLIYRVAEMIIRAV